MFSLFRVTLDHKFGTFYWTPQRLFVFTSVQFATEPFQCSRLAVKKFCSGNIFKALYSYAAAISALITSLVVIPLASSLRGCITCHAL
jgi:hypothetical protein